MLELNIDMDSIELEGRLISRPTRISRQIWMQFWEDIKARNKDGRCGYCSMRLPEARGLRLV